MLINKIKCIGIIFTGVKEKYDGVNEFIPSIYAIEPDTQPSHGGFVKKKLSYVL